jgi:molybdopterin molybdotransferase
MLTTKKVLNIILKYADPLGTEEIQIKSALGRVLAEKVYSDVDIPPFNRSAMDGFAVNSKDPSNVFEIIEDIPAGRVPKKRIRFGQSARIMTGAMLPKGADRVVKVENTKLLGSFIEIIKFEKKSNVSLRGEDVREGQLVLKKGTKIRPQEAAMLATVGRTRIKVYRQPKVAVISTGSEIVEPYKKPGQGQIRNSNSSMLMLQLKRLGIDAKYLGIAKDDFSVTEKLVRKGLRESDILILSGGVSVGDYDFVADVLKKCGVRILFNKIAVKPGKPTTFGVKGRKYVFGLPGNPVSVLVIFELFVVPFIDRLVNRATKNKFSKYKLLSDFKRRSAKREQYFPVIFKKGGAAPIVFHGSAHMQALTQADGIMLVPSGKTFIKKGSMVYARPI